MPHSSRVLIVEDEAIVAEDLRSKLIALGYKTVGVVSTGEEAIQAVQGTCVDVVLLDLQLAGTLDGIQTAQRLHGLSDAAIVFSTAHSDAETVNKANATAPFGYILKPFGERDLAVQLENALAQHRANRALKEQIVERKRVEQRLRKSEDLLLRAQRGAKAGVWEIDLGTGGITWSNPYYDLFGLNYSLQPSFDLWLSCVHPEDRARIATEYQRSIREHSDQHMEFRIVKADGSVRWIRRQGKVEFNEQGQALCIIGISLDITDHKQIEEAFTAAALFPAQNPSPVLRVNAAGVLLYMNPASERLLAELRLQGGQPVPQSLQDLVSHTLQTGRSEQFELDIGFCHYLISVTPIVKERYANLYWTDITQRKRAEQALRSSERRAMAFLNNSAIIAWLKDEEGRHVFLSENYVRRFGLRDWKDKTDFELWPSDIAEDFRKNDLMVLASGQPVEAIEQARMADGTVSFWLNSKFWFQDGSGRKFVGGVGVDITERKQVEEALRESEQRFRLANLATNEVIWDWTVASDTVVVNQNIATLYGWSEAAESSQPAAWWVERVHPEDRVRVVDHFFAAVNDPTVLSWSGDYRFQKSDGSYAHVLDRAYAVRDPSGKPLRMLGTMLDITERKRIEAALRESEERLQRVLETDAVGVLFFDHSGTLINANDVFLQQTGYRREQIDRRELHWRTMTPPEWIEASESQMEKFAQTGRIGPYEKEYYLADGSRRWMLFAGRDLGDGTLVEYCVDINDKKQAQFCLEHFAEELERKVTTRTAELLQSQERLRALATELNLSEQRERKHLAEQLHDHLQQMLVLGKLKVAQGKRIFPSADSLMRQLEEIFSEALTYTRTLVTELSPPVLREQGLTAAVKWLSEYMQKYEMVVHVSIPGNIPLDLPEDQKLLLFQSVRELLINASKHSGTHEAAVTIQRREGVLEIEVRDHGIGFDCAAVANSSKATLTGGLSSKFGLLSINERMRALGGTLDIQSSPGKGTVAILSLPLTITALEAAMLDHQLTLPSLGDDQNERISVLLVDDHPMMRQGLRAVLESYEDVQVIGEASTVRDAIRLVDHLHPQVVIMDINLPMENGIQTTAEIKARDPQVKVVGLSVNSSEVMVSAMLKAGAISVLNKESSGQHLYGAIKEAVKIQQPVPTRRSEPVHSVD